MKYPLTHCKGTEDVLLVQLTEVALAIVVQAGIESAINMLNFEAMLKEVSALLLLCSPIPLQLLLLR